MFLAALNYSTIITKNMMFQNLICFWSFGRFLLIVLNRIDMISFYKSEVTLSLLKILFCLFLKYSKWKLSI